MPGNDFEKQVKQKMDELHFAPSDALWPEVEKQITTRKKRRGLFLWLPFLILLLGAGVWVYYAGVGANANKKQAIGKKAVASSNSTDKAAGIVSGITAGDKQMKHTILSNDSITSPHANRKNNAIPYVRSNKIKSIAVIENTGRKNISPQANRKADMAAANKNNRYERKKNTVATIENNGHTDKGSNETYALEAARKRNDNKAKAERPLADDSVIAGAEAIISKNENDKTGNDAPGKNKVVAETPVADSAAADDSLVAAITPVKDNVKRVNETDSAHAVTKNKPAATAKKKIEWGISMNAGVSNISNGFSGLFSSAASYDVRAFSNNQNSAPINTPGTINGSTGNVSFAKPSDIRPGFAYSAGVFIHKQLGKSLKVLAGLNYSYYSTGIKVGARIDSNKALIQYSAGSSVNYTNGFHFIELPVTIEKQLGKVSPFSVNGGLAFSMLAGSNALEYDTQKNIYVKDNNNINKVQVSLLAGVRYRLFQHSLPIEIGPQFSYGLGNIFKKELYGSRHLFFGGISASIFFQKKNSK